MRRKRELTNEVLVRSKKVDTIVSNWMYEKSLSEVDPEACISLLVEYGVYHYDSKGKAHYFREDLRTLRDCGKIGIFEHIKVEQNVPGTRWVISLYNKNNVAK